MTPSRFTELERRCARLKKARIMRMVFTFLALFFIVFGIFYAYRPTWLTIPLQTKAETKTHPPAINPSATLSPEVPPLVVAPKEVPAIEDNTTNVADASMHYKDDVLFLAVNGLRAKAKLPENESQEALRSFNEEHRLINAFLSASTFENAYALAEFYFNEKSYLEAVAWAKKASTLDTHSPKPRLIYAKAKFYMGHKDDAISSLELFLSYIKSEEVEALLNFYKGQQ